MEKAYFAAGCFWGWKGCSPLPSVTWVELLLIRLMKRFAPAGPVTRRAWRCYSTLNGSVMRSCWNSSGTFTTRPHSTVRGRIPGVSTGRQYSLRTQGRRHWPGNPWSGRNGRAVTVRGASLLRLLRPTLSTGRRSITSDIWRKEGAASATRVRCRGLLSLPILARSVRPSSDAA